MQCCAERHVKSQHLRGLVGIAHVINTAVLNEADFLAAQGFAKIMHTHQSKLMRKHSTFKISTCDLK